jgi:sulfate adenylyltransferase subunit 1
MDLVNYSEEKYEQIKQDYLSFSKQLSLSHISFIPTSAFTGDNVVSLSDKMPWYKGKSLLTILETIEIAELEKTNASRFQVQYVIRPQTDELHDYRGLAGRVISGSYKKGQSVSVLPSGIETIITKIEVNQHEVEVAETNTPIILHLKDDLDISRGNTIVPTEHLPKTEKEFTATICWMDNTAYIPGQKILLQQNSFRTKAIIKEVTSKVDIYSNNAIESDGVMKLNDICKVQIKTAEAISFDSYKINRNTGSFILINENTNNTIAAGTID